MYETSPTQREPRMLYDGELGGIGGDTSFELHAADGTDLLHGAKQANAATLHDAIGRVLAAVSAPGMPAIEAVGYRVVHPGPKLTDHQRITPRVMRELGAAIPFAPLHDPAAIELIHAAMQHLPGITHFACFDTIFHQTMPLEATTYALPQAIRDTGVRRYGFHGLSCESVVHQLRAQGELPRRMILAHLGSGSSVTALVDGRSVDTTMGLTPTGGIVMGTRPGDLDPGVVLYLLRQQAGDKAAALCDVEAMLNRASGMVALSGLPNDVKAMRKAAAEGHEHATLALKVFTRSVTKAIGGFCWLLGGMDAIVFAGGIGEHDVVTRAEVLAGLGELGIALDDTLNQSLTSEMRRISAAGSSVAAYVVPAEEDRMIARHVARMALPRQDR